MALRFGETRMFDRYGKITGKKNIVLPKPVGGETSWTSTHTRSIANRKDADDQDIIVTFEETASIDGSSDTNIVLRSIKHLPKNTECSVIIRPVEGDTTNKIATVIADVLANSFKMSNIDVVEINDTLLNTVNDMKSSGVCVSDKFSYVIAENFLDEFEAKLEKNFGDIPVNTKIVFSDSAVAESSTLLKLNENDPLTTGSTKRKTKSVAWMGNFYVQEDVRPLVKMMESVVGKKGKFVTIAYGMSGTGKTQFAKALSEHLGLKYCEISSQSIISPEQWFIEREAVDGSTVMRYTPFHDALVEGGHVVLIDEISRSAPDLTNTLLPVLDKRGLIEVAGTETPIGESLIFILSANIGIQYTGTFEIDQALSNRKNAMVQFVDLPNNIANKLVKKLYGDVIDDATVKELVTNFSQLRKLIRSHDIMVDISTRALVIVSENISLGASMTEAFTYGILNTPEIDISMYSDIGDWIKKLTTSVNDDGGYFR